MSIVIETVNLSKEYRQGNETILATNKINIKIESGELVSIVGRSGSGKSTLLNLLGAIDTPTSGKILIGGRSLTEMADAELTKFRSKNIGIIFQKFNLIPELNVLENIRLPLDLTHEPYDNKYESYLIEMLELGNRLTYRPNQLSGGQQQRVAIARALITKPKIILADEPTGNLDKKTGDAIIEHIIRTNRDLGQTYIIVTHNNSLAQRTNRIITIDDGCVVSDFRKK